LQASNALRQGVLEDSCCYPGNVIHIGRLFDSLRFKIWESSDELSSVMILDPIVGNSLEKQIYGTENIT